MEKFLKENSLDRLIEQVDVDAFDPKMRKLLGPEVVEFYRQYGLASFGNGLIQSIHPVAALDILDGWNLPAQDKYPILKSSFGTIFFKLKNSIGYIDPVYRDIETKIANLGLLFDFFLSHKDVLQNAFFKDVHNAVYPRLGMLELDEIYAFVPALALGGAPSPENVEKVKMNEHLAFLSQL